MEENMTENEQKKYAVNTKVFEYNYGIKFIENSFVVNPACPDCGVTEVIDPNKFLAKVADIQAALPRLLKAASEQPLTCTDQTCRRVVSFSAGLARVCGSDVAAGMLPGRIPNVRPKDLSAARGNRRVIISKRRGRGPSASEGRRSSVDAVHVPQLPALPQNAMASKARLTVIANARRLCG